MKKYLPLILLGVVVVSLLVAGVGSYYLVPSIHNAVNGLFALDSAPTQAPADSSAPSGSGETLTVDFKLPANYDPLTNKDGKVIGITYHLNQAGPFNVDCPYQATCVVAAGKMTVGKVSFDTDGTIGNLYAAVCTDKKGCTINVEGYKAGHAAVAIVFGGNEVPAETVTWHVNNMLLGGSNCGNKCLTAVLGYADGKKDSFTAAIKADKVKLEAPKAPFAKMNLIPAEGVPPGSHVILSNGLPIGNDYFLAGSPAYVSIAETGGTVFYCGSKCVIEGITYKAGTAVVLTGGPTDGSTPGDLNRTVKIESKDPNMIRVFFFYSDFDSQLAQLKAAHSDWDWK